MKSKILNLKKKEDQVKFPLIEILAPIDCGKTPIAKLVARKLSGYYFSFPVLDPQSMTGRILLTSLVNNVEAIEAQPHWWSHIYAAHLYEQKEKLESLLEEGPVVVTNYTLAYRAWMNSLGLDMTTNLAAFTQNLPKVNLAIALNSYIQFPSTQPKFNFSFNLKNRISSSIQKLADSRVYKVRNEDVDAPYLFQRANKLCSRIAALAALRYNLEVDEKCFYDKNSFGGKN